MQRIIVFYQVLLISSYIRIMCCRCVAVSFPFISMPSFCVGYYTTLYMHIAYTIHCRTSSVPFNSCDKLRGFSPIIIIYILYEWHIYSQHIIYNIVCGVQYYILRKEKKNKPRYQFICLCACLVRPAPIDWSMLTNRQYPRQIGIIQ